MFRHVPLYPAWYRNRLTWFSLSFVRALSGGITENLITPMSLTSANPATRRFFSVVVTAAMAREFVIGPPPRPVVANTLPDLLPWRPRGAGATPEPGQAHAPPPDRSKRLRQALRRRKSIRNPQ